MAPALSIITVADNSERHLELAIESGAAQSFRDKEYTVVGSASTRGGEFIMGVAGGSESRQS